MRPIDFQGRGPFTLDGVERAHAVAHDDSVTLAFQVETDAGHVTVRVPLSARAASQLSYALSSAVRETAQPRQRLSA
jgi:hypothetical protein